MSAHLFWCYDCEAAFADAEGVCPLCGEEGSEVFPESDVEVYEEEAP